MQFADRAGTLNMAAFYYDYSNQQFINVDPAMAAQTLLNIPKSRIMGSEIELAYRLDPMMSLRLAAGFLDTKIKQGTVSGVNVQGNELSNAPSVTLTGGVDFIVMDGNAGKLSFHSEVSYASAQFFEVINVPRLEQKAYALLSGRIDYQPADERWGASLWAKNLTNKLYFTSRIDLLGGFGFDYNHIGARRTYGGTLSFYF